MTGDPVVPVSPQGHRGFVIDAAEEGDLPGILRVEFESFSQPWSESAFRSLLAREDAEVLVARDAREGVVGHAVGWTVLEEGELANIAVDPATRGKGLGGRLLDAMLGRLKAKGARLVFLEVRASNHPARILYEGRGFEVIARRPGYYRAPIEDALIMRKQLD